MPGEPSGLDDDAPPVPRGSVAFAHVVLLGSAGVLCGLVLYFFVKRPELPVLVGRIAPFLLAPLGLLVVALLRWSRLAKLRLALAITSLTITTFGFEAILVVTYFGTTPHQREAGKQGVPFDKRTPAQLVRDLRKNGVSVVPWVSPSSLLSNADSADNPFPIPGFVEHPLGAISNHLTVQCNESGEYDLYWSDEHGFRNSFGSWRVGIKALALGDSMVHGACVPPGSAITEVISEKGIPTLNLAMGGNGPLSMLGSLREYGNAVQPPAVLWFFYEGNDLADLRAELRHPVLRRYLEPDFSQGLIEHQDEIDAALTRYFDRMLEHLATTTTPGGGLRFLTLYHARTLLGLIGYRKHGSADLAAFERILAQAQQEISSWGGRMYFVYIPESFRYSGQGRAFDARDDVLSVVSRLQIPLIDFHPVIDRHPDPMSLFPMRVHGHYNADGYRLIGEEIARQVWAAGSN